jgi:hypothetical protein
MLNRELVLIKIGYFYILCVGDSHEGPLKNRGESLLQTYKKHKTQNQPLA